MIRVVLHTGETREALDEYFELTDVGVKYSDSNERGVRTGEWTLTPWSSIFEVHRLKELAPDHAAVTAAGAGAEVIDWDTALAPARAKSPGTVPHASSGLAAALRPPPFRTCGRCDKGFQRWPVSSDGEPSQEADCPRCRSVSRQPGGEGSTAGLSTDGTDVLVPIPY